MSTPDEGRVRALGGLFWEDFKVQDISDWYYRAPGSGFTPLQAPANSSVNNPNVRAPLIGFYDDVQRGYKQKAAFGSVDFDLIPKTLTLTLGTRYYNMDTYEVGAKQGSYGCRTGEPYTKGVAPSPCVNNGSTVNLDTLVVPAGNSEFSDSSVGLHKTYSGFTSRANLTYKYSADGLVYYTWSQGFRPGGFNRSSGFVSAAASPLKDVFLTPIGFAPDKLTNNEVGFKTQWLDHHLQVNGAVYQEDWKNVQIGLFDPGVLGNLTFSTNGPTYRVKGFETDVVARLAHGWSLAVGGNWDSSSLTNRPSLTDKSGKPIDFTAIGLHNPYGDIGSSLAMSPPYSVNFRVRNDFPVGKWDGFVQGSAVTRAHMYSSTDHLSTENDGKTSIAYDIPGYTSYDLSVGISKDNWQAQLYGTNITDVRGITYSSYAQRDREDYVIRPRTIMLKISYKFAGSP